jgi:hypothetical protein
MSCVECKDCLNKDKEIQKLKEIIIQLNYTKIPELYEFTKHTKRQYKKRETPTFTLTDDDIIKILNSMTYDWISNFEKSLSKMIVNLIINDNWKVNDKSRMICSYKNNSGKIIKFELKSWTNRFRDVVYKNFRRVIDENFEEDTELIKYEMTKFFLRDNSFNIWYDKRLPKSIINYLTQE